ncbi:hypothetical protein, partial [Herbaspirillum seropedicae]|uniref:hypothetical protein n=1 Tax=Herbaspirillum seropedicae TaxID=964 RepID=UPI003FCCE25B
LVVYNERSRYNRIRTKRDRLGVLLRIVEAAALHRWLKQPALARRFIAHGLSAPGAPDHGYDGSLDSKTLRDMFI